ncbi:MAG: HD domain-containing protein [Treponema sp.]|jgi:poly(A) polymerase|nr:HD domain-containing protein [Treponema sp.]
MLNQIMDAGFSLHLRSFSAIDRYLRLRPLPYTWLETNADVVSLAKIFGNLRYPGAALADACLDSPEGTLYFRCLEHDDALSFYFDMKTERFFDPEGVYPDIRSIQTSLREPLHDKPALYSPALAACVDTPFDAALCLARYHTAARVPQNQAVVYSIEQQRAALVCILLSSKPELGLNFLKDCGIIAELWPEIARLDSVEHSKDFHPEGNGWNHTLETFQYRKTNGLILSLALLLHDTGKALALCTGKLRFEHHAELGAELARGFLKRLGFARPLIDDVCFLVRNHMFPAALPRLPFAPYRAILESPLFPMLMDLYYCDESSSFKRLDNFHAASAVYRRFKR